MTYSSRIHSGAIPGRSGHQRLPHAGVVDALILQAVAGWAQRRLLHITGVEHVMPDRDPYILVLNHSTRFEAIAVPALLMYLRGGKRIHFMADWNFRLIPGVGFLYRRAGVITLTRKSARPRALNALRWLFEDGLGSTEAARRHLDAGRPLGIFPEGTVNRNARCLLRGRYGAAALSLETGASIVPVGVSFPEIARGVQVPETARFKLGIGAPMRPDADVGVKEWHAHIMQSIGRLSGKSWGGATEETDHEVFFAHPGEARRERS